VFACLCERVSDLLTSISELHEMSLVDFDVGLCRQQPKVLLRERLEAGDCSHKKIQKGRFFERSGISMRSR